MESSHQCRGRRVHGYLRLQPCMCTIRFVGEAVGERRQRPPNQCTCSPSTGTPHSASTQRYPQALRRPKRFRSPTADAFADTLTHTRLTLTCTLDSPPISVARLTLNRGNTSTSRKHRSSHGRQAGEVLLKRGNGLFTTLCKPHTPCMPHDPISICSCLLFSPAALTGPGQAVYCAYLHTHTRRKLCKCCCRVFFFNFKLMYETI